MYKHDNMIIAVDSTGIKVTNSGEWLRHKHGRSNKTRRGFLKVHVAVDIICGRVTGIVITEESSHDSKHLCDLVKQTQDHAGSVDAVLADGAYDSNEIFSELYAQDIKAIIPVRKTAKWYTGSFARRTAVVTQKRNFKQWVIDSDYGKRWISESVFSSIKRMFGESVMARKKCNMAHEVKLKIALYNRMVFLV